MDGKDVDMNAKDDDLDDRDVDVDDDVFMSSSSDDTLVLDTSGLNKDDSRQ